MRYCPNPKAGNFPCLIQRLTVPSLTRKSSAISSTVSMSLSLSDGRSCYVTEEQRHFGFFVHRESRLVRIQVKTGRLKPDGGSFIFDTQSIHHKNRTENVRGGYVGSAEYFAIYLPDNGKVYMIAINQAPKSDMELHFKSAGVNFGGRHGRMSHYTYEEALAMQFTVYWAEDYEIELRPL